MENPLALPASTQSDLINVVIESPAGADGKMKWEPELGVFALSRPLPLGLRYPYDWGFIPSTRAEDGDPLDALVLSDVTTFPGLLIRARPLGVVQLEQNKKHGHGRERNDRIVALPANTPRLQASSFRDLPPRVREEIEQFFLNAVFFEGKDAVVLGWGDANEAWGLVCRSAEAAEAI